MKVGRRKFLGLIGLSPIAAKAAADELTIRAASGGMPMIGNIPPYYGGIGSQTAIPNALMGPQEPYWAKPLRWFKTNGIPDWKDRELRTQARSYFTLDPDIAAKRSWSASVKMQEQFERNYQRLVENTKHQWSAQGLRDMFNQQNGFSI